MADFALDPFLASAMDSALGFGILAPLTRFSSMRSSITLFLSFALLCIGCADNAATQQVRSAASVDLGCHESSIEFLEDQPLEKTVRGCGRELTYVRQCGGASTGSCRWAAFPADKAPAKAPALTGSTGQARIEGASPAEATPAADAKADAGAAAPVTEQDPDSLD